MIYFCVFILFLRPNRDNKIHYSAVDSIMPFSPHFGALSTFLFSHQHLLPGLKVKEYIPRDESCV